jgi:hypothetical protein
LGTKSISSTVRSVGKDVALTFREDIAVAAPTSARDDAEPEDESQFGIIGRVGVRPRGEGRCDRCVVSVKFDNSAGSETVASGIW